MRADTESEMERCRVVVRAASEKWAALEHDPLASPEQTAAARTAWKIAQDAFTLAYMAEEAEKKRLLASLEKLLPNWTFLHPRRHSSYTRGPDGEYPMLGDNGHPVTVSGWVVAARNSHGAVIYSHAFDQAEDIVPYLSRYADLRPSPAARP